MVIGFQLVTSLGVRVSRASAASFKQLLQLKSADVKPSIAPLYYLIRRPTHILDFSLTLNFIHLILTTYYAKSFPTSPFYWVIQALGALTMIVVGEQVCVKREMRTELNVGWDTSLEGGRREEQIELVQR